MLTSSHERTQETVGHLRAETSRAWFLRRATATEKRQLRKASARYGRRISDWLDSQLPGRPTAETGCFLYLLEACEELG